MTAVHPIAGIKDKLTEALNRGVLATVIIAAKDNPIAGLRAKDKSIQGDDISYEHEIETTIKTVRHIYADVRSRNPGREANLRFLNQES